MAGPLDRTGAAAVSQRVGRLRLLAVSVMALACLASCSKAERPTLAAADTPTSVSAAPDTEGSAAASTTPLTDQPPGVDNLLGYIATPKGKPETHEQPSTDSPAVELGTTTSAGAPTTLAVIGDPSASTQATGGWLKVVLPIRPNQSTAWVPASSVELTQTPLRVFVDLGARTLRVEDNGAPVFSSQVAIGTEDNPTPTGASYVTELIRNTNPKGAYGPYAFGLALHSETLTEFAGGPGQVGIHGTNQPDLIGQPVSHGCVRLSNADIEKMVDLQLPLGVPVFIT